MLNLGSIVLLGNFNPALFHPEWFDRYKILPAQEIQSAEGLDVKQEEIQYKGKKLVIKNSPPPLIVTPDFTQLTFPSLQILVQQDRFECKTIQRSNFNLVLDVIFKTFSLLNHCIVNAVGTNFEGNWKYKEEGMEVLKNLFVREDEKFSSIYGPSYNIGGKIKYTVDECQITLDYSTSEILEGGICFRSNFHRKISSKTTKEALEILNENFENDLEAVIKASIDLLGEPNESITNE